MEKSSTLAEDLRLKTNVVTQDDKDVRVTTERPSPDIDPEIESIKATGSTSSNEDTESIETVIPQTSARMVKPYKKTTAINSEDTRKEVTITVGGEQLIHPIGSQGEHSVIHIRMWNRYILWLKKNGKKHGGYERFRLISRDKKGAYSRIILSAGKNYQCFGPFTTTIALDGLEMRIPIYITTNDDFGGKLTLGDEVWKPRKIAAITGCLDKEQVQHPIDENSRTELTVRGMRFNVLVDTGAGPSCMATTRIYCTGREC